MLQRLRQLLQIRPGEGYVTALMFCYIFGVLTFYYVLKPIRSGLFLKSFPSSQLPYAYFLTAILAGTVATLVFKVSRRTSAITLVTGTNLGIIATLFYFWWAMGRQIWYLPYVYFVYVQLVSVLSTTQFWLLAGYVYDNQQAKRIYGFLGAGAIAGAMAGSAIPAFMAARLSTQSMLLICIGVCAALIVFGQMAWRCRRPDAEPQKEQRRKGKPSERFSDLWRMVFGSPHLFMMTLLIFFTLIASQITEWQINDAAQSAFAHLSKNDQEREINEFFGQFYFVTNILGIALQVLATGFVVRRFGILATILFLPTGLLFGSVAVVATPSLWATAVARGSDAVFRYSLNRAGLELLYLPLSPLVRKKLKVFVDVFIDRTGRAVAGVVILAFTSSFFPVGLRGTAVVTMVMTAICIGICLKLRGAYVSAFRQQLARREVDLTEIARYVTDPASVRLLVSALEGANERRTVYALRLLESVRGADFSREVLPLLDHRSPLVRQQALRTLHALPGDLAALVERLLADDSDGVRFAAVDYLARRDPGRLNALLTHRDIGTRLTAARWAGETAGTGYSPTVDFVRGLLAIDGIHGMAARVAAAGLAGHLPRQQSVEILELLLREPHPEVAAAAAKAAAAAGRLELLFDVLRLLRSASTRGLAREALVTYGARAIGTLGDVLGDPEHDLAVRREIPWVLARIPVARSADLLVDNLGAEDPLLKCRVVKALNRLHESDPALPHPKPAIADRIYVETRAYYEALAICQTLGATENGQASLLKRAVRERLDQNLEIIFRLLGLQYPQRDIYFAYTAIKGNHGERRSAAIEFLDNVLNRNLKSLILPLVEEASPDTLIGRAMSEFGISVREREDAIRLLLAQTDPWLRACALHEVGAHRLETFRETCAALKLSSDRLTRETADWAFAQLVHGPLPPGEGGGTPGEGV